MNPRHRQLPQVFQRSVLALLTALVLVSGLLLGPTQSASAAAGTNTLFAHERLSPGQFLESASGILRLYMQGDGNLVLYSPTGPMWATHTAGRSGAWLGNQGDGNLVLYHNGVAIWASGTPGQGLSDLVLQNDGNLVLYKRLPDGNRHATWASGTFYTPTSDRAALGARIRDHARIQLLTSHVSGIYDPASTARQNIVDTANGQPAKTSTYSDVGRTNVYLDTRMLQAMLRIADSYSYRVTTIAGGDHSTNSRHYAGLAFDVDMINGARFSSRTTTVSGLMQACRNLGAIEVLGPGDAGHSTHVHCGWPR